jgi:CMP-N-acetylneuraminic acid synthetase
MLQINKEGLFEGFFPSDTRPEYYNLPRQLFPKAYHPNGYVDVVRTEFVERNKLLYGDKVLAFVTDFSTEVDTLKDFEYLEYCLNKFGNPVYEYLTEHFPKENG